MNATTRTWLGIACSGLVAAVAAGFGILGAIAFFSGESFGSGFRDDLVPAFGVDPLSGFFLLTLAVVAVPVCVFAHGYLCGASNGRLLTALAGAFLLAMCGFLVARDPVSLLACWELMTLIPAAAILVRSSASRSRRIVFTYLAITHLGGVGAWVCVIALADYGALSDPDALLAHGVGAQTLVIVAAMIGFGTKMGMVPLHSWLPRAHPVAPAFFSALMSGVMVKLGVYGLIRVLFEWAAPVPAWTGWLLLGVGVSTALVGIAYALFQRELKTLLAFSTIENVGLVVTALGVSTLLSAANQEAWAALAFAAALLQVAVHAVTKALLFCGAGAFERAVGSLDLDRLGGLLRRMPWSGGVFLLGCVSVAALPPLGGFVAEWLTLQTLIHLVGTSGVPAGVAAALATAGVGMTAALALYCFVRVVGQVLLGSARTDATATATEAPAAIRAGLVLLAVLCVVLGLLGVLLVPHLAGTVPGLATPVGSGLGFEPAGTGGLPMLWIALGLAVLVAFLWKLRGTRRVEAAPAWACGQEVEPAMGWTGDGFSKPLRLVLEAVLRPRREVDRAVEGGLTVSVSYRGSIPHLFDTAIFGPLRRLALRAARSARRMQSGSVRAYAGYLLALLLLGLLLIRVGALG